VRFTQVSTPLQNSTPKITVLAKNLVVLGIGEFASKVCGFAAFAYLARVLGPKEFGQIEFALAVTVFFTLLVDSGLGTYGAREVAKGEIAPTRLTLHVVVLRFLLALGAFALLAFGVAASDKPGSTQKLLFLYGLTLLVQPTQLSFVFQGRELMGTIATASVLRWSLFAGGVLLLTRGPGEIWFVPLIEIAAMVCVAGFYFRAFSRSFGQLRQPIDYGFLFRLWRHALPIGASELVWALKVYFATVMLGVLVHGPELGWFAAAHRIVLSLHTFVWLYFFNLLPVIVRSGQGSLEARERLIRTSMRFTVCGGLTLGIVGTVFAGPILTLIYGSQYQEATAVFEVLIWLLPLALMSGHYRYLLIGHNRQNLEFLTAVFGAGLNVALNTFLTPSYGVQAAAWALIASEVLIWVLAYYFVRRTIALGPISRSALQPLHVGVERRVFAQVRSLFVRQR
jgi:PST family polysaccharide transporter